MTRETAIKTIKKNILEFQKNELRMFREFKNDVQELYDEIKANELIEKKQEQIKELIDEYKVRNERYLKIIG